MGILSFVFNSNKKDKNIDVKDKKTPVQDKSFNKKIVEKCLSMILEQEEIFRPTYIPDFCKEKIVKTYFTYPVCYTWNEILDNQENIYFNVNSAGIDIILQSILSPDHKEFKNIKNELKSVLLEAIKPTTMSILNEHNMRLQDVTITTLSVNELEGMYFNINEGKFYLKRYMGKVNLSIELVPESCWFSNIRSNVTKKDWDILRKECYQSANYKCEICNGTGDKHPVEAHEVWHYDDLYKVQRLERLISLCPSCHQVKHIGYANISGKYDEAFKHLMKINYWSENEALFYVDQQFTIWNERSKYNWALDIEWLKSKNIEVIETPK